MCTFLLSVYMLGTTLHLKGQYVVFPSAVKINTLMFVIHLKYLTHFLKMNAIKAAAWVLLLLLLAHM